MLPQILLANLCRWLKSKTCHLLTVRDDFYGSYHPDSPQLQLRRLGDLAFLLGLYDLAYSSYHSAKKDFEADQAWLHYAGALEMAALSSFLQGSTSGRGGAGFPSHYFDLALTTYLQTCKSVGGVLYSAIIKETFQSILDQSFE